MDKNFSKSIDDVKQIFSLMTSPDERYSYIIELGRKLPKYPSEFITDKHIVPGCQSVLYLNSTNIDGKLFFSAHCDALISLGLAALLISIYSGLDAKTILLNPPIFLHELGLIASLSPTRSNGLANMYGRIKKEALESFKKA